MKHFNVFKFIIVAAVAMVSSQVWGETATITFANQTSGESDSNKAYTIENFVSNGITSPDEALGTITCSATEKCYSGKIGYGMKMGMASSAGSFTISFTALSNVTKIVLNRASYNDNTTANITVKNGEATLANEVSTPSSSVEFSDMEITGLNIASLSSLTVSSSKYCYIKSITITYGSTPSGKTDVDFTVQNVYTESTITSLTNIITAKPNNYDGTFTFESSNNDVFWIDGDEGVALTQGTCTLIVTASATGDYNETVKNVALTVNVPSPTPSTTCTLSFNLPECVTTTPEAITAYTGKVIKLSTITPAPEVDIPNYTFVGWADAAQTELTNIAPTLLTKVKLNTDTEIYAIYRYTTQQPTGEFKLSFNKDEVDYYFNGGITNSNKYASTTTTEATACAMGIEDDTYLYYWNGETKTYVGGDGDKTDLVINTNKESIKDNNNYKWTFTITDGFLSIQNIGTDSRNLAFNGSDRFAAYKASTGGRKFTRHDIKEDINQYTSEVKCLKTYSVTYDADGGETSCEHETDLQEDTEYTICETAPTREGFAFKGWSDGSTTYQPGDKITLMGENTTITLTAQWNPIYTISWQVNGAAWTEGNPSTTAEKDSAVSKLPTAPTLLDCDDEKLFMGWTNAEINQEQAKAPSILYTNLADFPVVSGNATYYAVFASEIGGDYTRVTADQEDWSGDYLIAYSSTVFADGKVGGTDGIGKQNASVNPGDALTENTIAKAWGDQYKVTFEACAGGYVMKTQDGNYNYQTSNENGIAISANQSTAANNPLTITYGADSVDIAISAGAAFRYSTQGYFRFYKKENDKPTQNKIYLYKKTNISYSNYVTTCRQLDHITLVLAKSEFRQEEPRHHEGATVTAYYNDNSSRVVTDNLTWTDGENAISVTYTERGIEKSDSQTLTIIPTYQVTYNTDGGLPAVTDAERYAVGEMVTLKSGSAKMGYKFTGWSDNVSTYQSGDQVVMVAGGLTFTAQWQVSYTLILHYDGYTTDCDAIIGALEGEQITLPAGKAVAGKTFAGWSDGNGHTYTAGEEYTMPANNVTLTATYSNFSLSVSINGQLYANQQEVATTGFYLPVQDSLKDDKYTPAPNNHLVGYTKTAINNETTITDLPADFIPAGSVYIPTTENETLYALYRQGDSTYQLIKDTKDLRLGAHVVLASFDEDYAMGNTFISGQDTLPAITVTKDDGAEETITFGNEVQEWVLTTSSQAGSSAEYQGTWAFQRADSKKLASQSAGADKVAFVEQTTVASSFRITIDASGRATARTIGQYTHNTLSMGENGFFACYLASQMPTPDLAIYQHIGTKYVTSPTAVYRVKSVDMVNGRLDKNDYYAVNDTITLSGYANDGYSTSNRYIVLGEAERDTISKTRGFRMPAYNVVDTLTNRAKQDTITFMAPECVIMKSSVKSQKVDWNTELILPKLEAINSWNFIGWTKTAINDTAEVHSEIFTTYTIPHVDRDTFYAIYSYDGLETEGFVLSTVNNGTTYYLGSYVSGSDNYYFSVTTDKGQALTLYLDDNKLYYLDGGVKKYLRANYSSSSYSIRIEEETNKASASDWTITTNDNGTTTLSCTVNDQTRKLQLYNNNRYSIYTNTNDPVKEKAPSYTTNPVCDEYIHYFVSDAEDADPEFSYKLGNDGKAAQYYPQNGCATKRFIGWSETKVSDLQQSAPAMVDVATQTYDHTQNLYAVYAAENGGKITSEYDRNIIESISDLSYFKTEQDSGMASLNTRYTFHNAKFHVSASAYFIRLTKGSGVDTSYITTSLIRGLKQIQVRYNTSNIKPLVYISSDGTEWTNLKLSGSGETHTATPTTPGDYYVAYCIEKSTSSSKSYSDISTLTYSVISPNRYWLSDYSTNCTVAETATISFKNSDDSQAEDPIAANPVGQVITLPTPKMEGKHFDYWIINEVQYAAGDEYKLSHGVTATASWSDPQLTCDVETLYVASAKGITNRSSMVAHISCPEITTGTLETPADIDQNNGKLHFILENATATEDGLNATLMVEYTGKTATTMADKQVTLTIGSVSTTITVSCALLPDQFVIAHQGSDNKWYALPADITAFGTYKGYEITVNNNNEATAPQNAVYRLGAGQDATAIRLMADTLALMTSATASAKTKIKVGTDTLNTLSYWKIVTDNDNTIALVNTAANNSLKFNNDNKFGMYATGTSNDSLLHIFKVTTTIATIPIETMNWTENSFSFIPSTTMSIPANNEFRLRVNDEDVATATCTAHNALYDVTSSTTFGAQKLVQLQWYNNNTLVATASAITPLRLTANVTLANILGCDTLDAKSLDIIVTSGILTVDAKATIHNLDIYPGATVAITNDTLTATTLSFHGGLTSTESNYDYDVPRLYIQKEYCTTAPGYLKKNARIYYYLNVNADNYYPFTVPFKTTGANIRYASRPNTEIQSIWGNAIVISQYNGEARGKGEATTTKYWKDLSYNNDLNPGVGYIITAKKLKGEPYAALRIMMMASDIDATTDAVSVGAWGVDDDKIAWYNKGWNYIANPYTAMLTGSVDEGHHAIQSGTDVRYATIPSPTVDGYDQVPIEEAELKPFYGFFIQAGATGDYNFVKNNLHSVPAYLLAEEKPEQEAYINLEGATMHDRFGLIVGQRHSDDYEINADLSKELGTANDLRAWLMSGDMKMAYLAVDDETAATLIPLNLRTPAESEYTFSLRESSRVDDLESLFLYDYETGSVTNLLYNDYTFSAPAGAVEKRFALNAIRAAHAPTELGEQTDRLRGRGDPPYKRLKDGHIYIIVNSAIYNAEGKEVRK